MSAFLADTFKLKNVVIACSVPEEPKSYKISPRADITVIFYRRLKVLENFAFEPGKMTDDDVTSVIGKVEKRLQEGMKKPTKKD